MEKLAPRLDGAIVAVGNAPTALWKVMEIARARRPAAGAGGRAAGGTGRARGNRNWRSCESDLCYITNTSARGGSPVAAAAVNALAKLHHEEP